jgi:hypothetical protein
VLFVALGLLVWLAVSFALAPLMGLALRRCALEERLNAVEVLQAKAQHPAARAA